MKQELVRLARKTKILPALEHVRFMTEAARSWSGNRRVRQEHPELALPPLWICYDAYSHCRYESYLRGGQVLADYLKSIISEEFKGKQDLKVLEWGCGPGRVIRWMDQHRHGGQVFGCDYNQDSVTWCATALPEIQFRKNELSPPLPYGDAGMDVVYAWSVFTHLSEAQVRSWIAEITRVLKPGGAFLFSTQSEESRHKLMADEQEAFDRTGLVVRDRVVEGSRLFAAFHARDYVRKAWGASFATVRDLGRVPNTAWDQCVWVARKGEGKLAG